MLEESRTWTELYDRMIEHAYCKREILLHSREIYTELWSTSYSSISSFGENPAISFSFVNISDGFPKAFTKSLPTNLYNRPMSAGKSSLIDFQHKDWQLVD
jgi:hypothetical protein